MDQHDNPMVVAKIEISLNTSLEILNRDLFTGGDGTFALTGVSGKFLSVNAFGLDGYTGVRSTNFGDYNYAEPGEHNFHVPDPNKPVVFRLWKYEKPEPLYRKTIDSSVRTDGTIGWFDLKSGVSGKGGLGVIVIDLSPKNGKEVHWKEGDASQDDPGKFRFYFRDADGSYAAVNASLRFASDVKCDVFSHTLQNPSGSRNLEYDPRLEIK